MNERPSQGKNTQAVKFEDEAQQASQAVQISDHSDSADGPGRDLENQESGDATRADKANESTHDDEDYDGAENLSNVDEVPIDQISRRGPNDAIHSRVLGPASRSARFASQPRNMAPDFRTYPGPPSSAGYESNPDSYTESSGLSDVSSRPSVFGRDPPLQPPIRNTPLFHKTLLDWSLPFAQDLQTKKTFPLSYACSVNSRASKASKPPFEEGLQERGSYDQSWSQRHTRLSPGVETELLVINAAESFADEKDGSYISLTCQAHEPDKTEAAPPNQMHWLHVKYETNVVDDLKMLVTSCPSLRTEVKQLAISLLGKAYPDSEEGLPRRETWRSAKSVVRRADGYDRNNRHASCSAAFMSTPYVVLREKQRQRGRDSMESLLSFHHDCDVSQQEDSKQIVNVAHLGCLVLGSGVLLTWGEIGMTELRKDKMILKENEARPPVMVLVRSHTNSESSFFIQPDTSFADLVVHIASSTPQLAFRIHLGSHDGPYLTPARWATALEDAASTPKNICLALHYKARATRPLRSRHQVRPRRSTDYLYQAGRKPQDSRALNTRPSGARLKSTAHSSPNSSGTDLGQRHSREKKRRPDMKKRDTSHPQRQRRDHEGEDSKIINDMDLNLNASWYYWVTSSDDDSTDKEVVHRQFDATHPHPSSRSKDEDPQFTQYKEEVQKSRSPDRTDIGKWPLSQPLVPFLMWGAAQKEGRQEDDINSMVLERLLRRANVSLGRDELYKSGFKCSWEDLLRRHREHYARALSLATSEDTVAHNDQSIRFSLRLFERESAVQTPSDAKAEVTLPAEEPSEDTAPSAQPHPDEATENVSIQDIEECIQLFLSNSRAIMELFVPFGFISMDTEEQQVISRYWGAVDVILRTLRHLAKVNPVDEEQTWVVRGSCQSLAQSSNLPSTTQESTECDSCIHHKAYPLKDAIQHIHSALQPSDHDIPAEPSEDPCIVWLESTDQRSQARHSHPQAEAITEFRSDLDEIHRECMNLHGFFAPVRQPTGPDVDDPKSDTRDEPLSESRLGRLRRQKISDLPGPPRDMLKALKRLIAFFTARSQMLQMLARRLALKDHDLEKDNVWLKEKRRCVSLKEKVFVSLRRAQEVLIQDIGDKNAATKIGVAGPEGIAALAVTNIQQGALKAHSITHTNGYEKKVAMKSGRAKTRTWLSSLNFLKKPKPEPVSDIAKWTPVSLLSLYESHLAKVKYDASVSPRKGAFHAARALEMELKALLEVESLQSSGIYFFEQVINPSSFRMTTRSRYARFTLERNTIDSAIHQRNEEYDRLTKMLGEVQVLRAGAVEALYVRNDDYANVSRVFMLATSAFLPLALVSSLYIVNMVNDRHAPSNLALFWSIIASVTFGVLASVYHRVKPHEATTTGIAEILAAKRLAGARGR